jgi:hypothetical protein
MLVSHSGSAVAGSTVSAARNHCRFRLMFTWSDDLPQHRESLKCAGSEVLGIFILDASSTPLQTE